MYFKTKFGLAHTCIELKYKYVHVSTTMKQFQFIGIRSSNYISNCLKDSPIVIAKISKGEQNLVDNLRSNVYNKKESKLFALGKRVH